MRRQASGGYWLWGTAIFAIAGAVILLDRVTKLVVLRYMVPAQSFPIIDNIFHLTYVRNSGAAFGLLPGMQPLFFVTTGVVIGFILLYWLHVRPTDPLLVIGLGLELGGAIGNLIDRMAWGSVIDFLDFRFWPVFNFADCSVFIGLFVLLLAAVRQSRRDAERREEAA